MADDEAIIHTFVLIPEICVCHNAETPLILLARIELGAGLGNQALLHSLANPLQNADLPLKY